MYRAIFISDIHLGSSFNKSKQIFELLEHIESEKIFLVGDIINTSAPSDHPDIIRFITILQSKPWEIIYISGNHEDDRKLPPISMDFNKRVFSKEREIYINSHNSIYIEHGHSFHHSGIFNRTIKVLSVYWRSIVRYKNRNRDKNRNINNLNIKTKPKKKTFYYRILKPVAQKLLISSFRYYMGSLAKKSSCDVVICGHFHLPEDRTIKGIRYINCGDWIENSSFVVEEMSGELLLKTL